ncbi:hypothetical protein MZO42_03465 [Sphingomonas psychrotolerans]|uniref:Uncharacterized protein n=1 Tax=Sphingomonas psychrotolerans TaxID=1327635 RepID=A0ABU3N3B9_9SPHN|nr:hypothetical protein [Sphingomonas psychrotolerans]MDT8757745.1 hypothetical protein [Sphingomonas psychrotolerans]
MTPGPPLERVMRRLAETPDDFLAEPRIGDTGDVVTAALVGDLFHALGHAPADAPPIGQDRNRLQLTAVAVWLLADEWVAAAAPDRATLAALLGERIGDLAASGRVDQFVGDVDRREELARTLIAALGLVPAGESEAQAADRLSAVSVVERRRLLRASQEAEERARAVREALIRKAAEESADKYTRE